MQDIVIQIREDCLTKKNLIVDNSSYFLIIDHSLIDFGFFFVEKYL